MYEIVVATDDGVCWFAQVVSEDGDVLHTTGPRPDPDAAAFSAQQWLRNREERPASVMTVGRWIKHPDYGVAGQPCVA